MKTNSTFQSLTPENTNETRKFQDSFILRYLSFYALVLIIVGTIGNILTLIVLLRRNLRRFVTVRYLIIVSICDTISLYGWNLNNFYKFNISPRYSNIEDLSLVHCRLISFMTFSALQLSSWCLSAVSLDRALSLYWLEWKQTFGRKKYTKYYIAILTIICIAINMHMLFLNGYYNSSGRVTCYSTLSNPGYIYPKWERVHLLLYNLGPFTIMCICNAYIIFITVRSSQSRLGLGHRTVPRKSLERYRQFTVLLIIVTFAFVILTLPACIYFVFFRKLSALQENKIFRYKIQILLNSIQFTSHAINFFLYCFSARSFRHELDGMFYDLLSVCFLKCMSPDKINRNNVQRQNNKNRNVENVNVQKSKSYRHVRLNSYKDESNPQTNQQTIGLT